MIKAESGKKSKPCPGLALKKDKGKRIKDETGKQFICIVSGLEANC
jgi:hypothetical protein